MFIIRYWWNSMYIYIFICFVILILLKMKLNNIKVKLSKKKRGIEDSCYLFFVDIEFILFFGKYEKEKYIKLCIFFKLKVNKKKYRDFFCD